MDSPILQEYVMQMKETELNVRRKMGNFFTDENGLETLDTIGVRQTQEEKYPKLLYLLAENGGSDGTRTRGLRRDRPAL